MIFPVTPSGRPIFEKCKKRKTEQVSAMSKLFLNIFDFNWPVKMYWEIPLRVCWLC